MNPSKHVSRRNLLKTLGGLGAATLIGCGTSSGVGNDGGSGGTTGGSGGTNDGSGTTGGSGGADASSGGADAGSGADSGTFASDGAVSPGGFAVGSGAFLDGKDYGNPFASGIGSVCTVYKTAIEGPCHSNTYYRKDISDGLVGLPTRLEFLLVDASCNPVPNAIIEVWFASPAGTYSQAAQAIDDDTGYSGSLSDLDVSYCTGNDSEALASNWLRGFQYTGSDGRATIDGIFPGWYASRSTHIHFIVTANGKQSVISQLFFDDTFNTTVYTQHPSYKARGDKDTTNAKDMVVKQLGGVSSALMSYAQQSDGAIVAWKAITINT